MVDSVKQPVDGLYEGLVEFLPGILNGTVTARELAASAILIAGETTAGRQLDRDLISLANAEIEYIRATESSGNANESQTSTASRIIEITQLEGEK